MTVAASTSSSRWRRCTASGHYSGHHGGRAARRARRRRWGPPSRSRRWRVDIDRFFLIAEDTYELRSRWPPENDCESIMCLRTGRGLRDAYASTAARLQR